jgi:hypothetical protein
LTKEVQKLEELLVEFQTQRESIQSYKMMLEKEKRENKHLKTKAQKIEKFYEAILKKLHELNPGLKTLSFEDSQHINDTIGGW